MLTMELFKFDLKEGKGFIRDLKSITNYSNFKVLVITIVTVRYS